MYSYIPGKKGKKSKGKTVALHDFLADTPGGLPSMPLKSTNWADDIEDEHGKCRMNLQSFFFSRLFLVYYSYIFGMFKVLIEFKEII